MHWWLDILKTVLDMNKLASSALARAILSVTNFDQKTNQCGQTLVHVNTAHSYKCIQCNAEHTKCSIEDIGTYLWLMGRDLIFTIMLTSCLPNVYLWLMGRNSRFTVMLQGLTLHCLPNVISF